MISHRRFVCSIELEEEYDSIEDLNKALEEAVKEGFDEARKYHKFSEPDFQLEYGLSTSYNEDYGHIRVDIYRSEKPEEKQKREEYQSKVEAEKAAKQKVIDDAAALKKARLEIAQGDPDYDQYVKLKERFKDLD